MKTFSELYTEILTQSVGALQQGKPLDVDAVFDYDPFHLECLLHPHSAAPVIALGECACGEDQKTLCQSSCLFDALVRDPQGNLIVDAQKCTGCAQCLQSCTMAHLVERKEVYPVLDMLTPPKVPVYALVAPAVVGQFGTDTTVGKLRSACKRLGFAGLLEVSLFADILTLKEALEFDLHIQSDADFVLTSCCCPIWIAMIRRIYQNLVPHIPASVSPMVAAGRAVKLLYPGAKTVFIGPCLAKKAEAREADVQDAIDFVLNFQELQDIFQAAGLDLQAYEEDTREHSSTAGRIYARGGGVSEAVQRAVQRLKPNPTFPLTSYAVSGTAACKALLERLKHGEVPANFLEGMGCVGGCVGGPRNLIPTEEGKMFVDQYGEAAASATPIDNPSVLKLLDLLGFNSVEALLEKDAIFTRDFSQRS